jgi:branched-chain amino acid transport system permease protein
MDLQIALLLGQDGVVNGAVYALLALALVLVFSVTRVILIPQGEFVSFGALSMAALQAGHMPATFGLVAVLAAAVLVLEAWRWRRGVVVDWRSTFVWAVIVPAFAALLAWAGMRLVPGSLLLQSLATLLLITPLGPLLYRLAFRPLADATVLVLLIVSVALHGVLVGLGLLFFGAEGSRTPAFSEARIDMWGIAITGQSLVVVGVTVLLVVLMFVFFERSIIGKALRATAINRVGARLMGIPTEL